MMSLPVHISRRTGSTLALLSILAAAVNAAPSIDSTLPSIEKRLTQTYSGCYSSSQGLTEVGTYTYQSTGYCGGECTGNGNQAVLGLTNGNDCWCGNELPPASSKVDDSKCNVGCTGYGDIDCGGSGFWSVYLTGTEANVPNAGSSSSSSAAPHTTSAPSSTSSVETSATTAPQQVVTSVVYPYSTVVVTQSATSTPTSTSDSSSKDKGGSNTAAVAAGVVVGIVAVAAIVGGVFFFLRRRRQRQAEEDYKRNTQVADFMRSTSERKPPGTGYSQASDTRLEPEFGARRNSVGSMADSQDYSRRILRVANPDGH